MFKDFELLLIDDPADPASFHLHHGILRSSHFTLLSSHRPTHQSTINGRSIDQERRGEETGWDGIGHIRAKDGTGTGARTGLAATNTWSSIHTAS